MTGFLQGKRPNIKNSQSMNIAQLENELWEAADQLRANSKLTAAEYSMPVLGLIFLRHADNRFKAYLPDIKADIPTQVPPAQREELIKLGFQHLPGKLGPGVDVAQREELIKLGFQGKAAIYLPQAARFDHLVALPQGASVGAAIDTAMGNAHRRHSKRLFGDAGFGKKNHRGGVGQFVCQVGTC
jgi:type I restriction enzyme M protein